MLYLVATPIGNLGDITFRAIETLKSSDYILCEDTRHSLKLLNHYEIKKPLHSYHKFNEASREDRVIKGLQEGKIVSLISDAGTPGISDPGMRLVRRCREEGIEVVSIPGACAAIVGITSSGMNTERFQFWGFLPRKSGRLQRELEEIFTYQGTTICYESPHRILKVLAMLEKIAPTQKLAVARELTKKFEEIRTGTPTDLLEHWKGRTVKGEIVLLFSNEPEKKNKKPKFEKSIL